MVGMKFKKVSAASLMEVLVSMAIIMIVVSIGTLVFVNVTGSSITGEKMKSYLLMKEVSRETLRAKRFFDEELTKDHLKIVKHVMPYQGRKDLYILHLSAFNENEKLLGERKEILYLENE